VYKRQDLKNQIEVLISTLELNDKIKLLGNREDIPVIMRKSDIFILSSQYEGFGLVVAEAMSSGCRVVATDSGGVKEIAGDFARLVPINNPKSPSDAILDTIDEKCSYDTLVQQHTYIDHKFSKKKFISAWIKLYDSMKK
jgi:glycosyltransferase involved in cell wall biosynthesis